MQGASSVPPGPRGPFIFRARRALRDPYGFLTGLARTYGDVVRFRLGSNEAFLVNNPALIQLVLVERAESFSKTSLTPATYRLVGDSLFSSEDPTHARDRRAIQPLFRHEQLDILIDTAVEVARDAASGWRRAQILDAREAMARVSLRVALAGVLSIRREAEVASFGAALEGALKAFERTLHPIGELMDRLPLPSTGRIDACSTELERVVDTAIAARRAKPGVYGDLLDLLVQLRYNDGEKEAMSDAHMRHEALDLIIGSNETVALALTWSLYELARNKDAQVRVASQAVEVLGDRKPRLQDTPALTLARAAFNEALRLHPPAWAFLRRAKVPVEIGVFRVPAGGLVLVSPYVTQHDPRFFPEPTKFDLARWEGAVRSSRPKFAYFPFGGGPRSCLGEPLATAEGTAILADLVRALSFDVAGEAPAKEWALGLHAPGPVPVGVVERTKLTT